ncbi:MAG: DUF1572 family protein [Flavobacteriia bacterium]|nr:DUF1572 family protein [Flavobacteriia bacterium]
MNTEQKVLNEFQIRVFDENYPRIYKCLSKLNEEQLWISPNSVIPPIGNIILHLCGNVTQWIVHGIGNEMDKRKREEEFLKQNHIRKSDLIFLLQHVKIKVETVFKYLKIEDLHSKKNIQGFDTDGVSILCHVMEHFSYHTGQITLLTKWFTKEETNYYDNNSLN